MFLISLADWTWLRKESLSLVSYQKATKQKSKENKDSKQNKTKEQNIQGLWDSYKVCKTYTMEIIGEEKEKGTEGILKQ